MYELAGYEDGKDYEDPIPEWESEETYADIDSASAAARSWLEGFPDGSVTVLEVRGSIAGAVRIISRHESQELSVNWRRAERGTRSGIWSRVRARFEE